MYSQSQSMSKTLHALIYLTLFIISICSCNIDPEIIYGCTDQIAINYNQNANIDNGSCNSATPYNLEIPYGFPNMLIPENNPMTLEGVDLGKKLFNDPILSADNTQSCSSCHLQIAGFSDTNQFSIGINGSIGDRNASTIINPGWNSSNFWDGRATTLEDQAFEPIVNEKEMNNTWENVEKNLNENEEYLQLFKNAFNIEYIDSIHVAMAIAQFERTLISTNSKFDKWLNAESQLTPSELRGYTIFNSEKGDCFH